MSERNTGENSNRRDVHGMERSYISFVGFTAASGSVLPVTLLATAFVY